MRFEDQSAPGLPRVRYRRASRIDMPPERSSALSFPIPWTSPVSEVAGLEAVHYQSPCLSITTSKIRRLTLRKLLGSQLQAEADRKSVVSGKSVSVRVDLGGGRIIKKNNK